MYETIHNVADASVRYLVFLPIGAFGFVCTIITYPIILLLVILDCETKAEFESNRNDVFCIWKDYFRDCVLEH